jgi:hypothetical protein
MTLRDRLRRWWSPAKWDDDHPLQRSERAARKKPRSYFGDYTDVPNANTERDFKKPR